MHIRISKFYIRSSTFGYSIGARVRNRRAIPKAAWLLPPELTRREGVLIAPRPLRLRSALFVKLRAYFVILGATCVAQLKELIRSLIGTRLSDRYYRMFEFTCCRTCHDSGSFHLFVYCNFGMFILVQTIFSNTIFVWIVDVCFHNVNSILYVTFRLRIMHD